TGAPALDQFGRLGGWRVNVGTQDSGGPLLFQRLAQANQLPDDAVDARNLEPSQAVAQLLDGALDAVVLPQAAESPLVQMLLQTPGIRLLDFPQAEAYARRLSFLSHVVLPRGIVALGRDLPPQDFHLVATTATLVARDGAHPALVRLMVQAAADIHGGASWFRRAGEFPNAVYSEIPVAEEAARHYRNGRPLLQQYLPFWVANLVDRMWVVLTVIVAMLLPLSRIVPPIYQFRVRSRIFRWYAQLRRIEEDAGRPAADHRALADELDALESRVGQIAVPLSYADELYALRSNIGLVRSRLK
ncbi:MAG TPA: TAXI family TRAP transporter solute-binding subunit, partial [Burkholderiaceae bacterium]|nr:TAXI family TRAP transporter solute-binding subunit [Burkholderiaceae bacterium]